MLGRQAPLPVVLNGTNYQVFASLTTPRFDIAESAYRYLWTHGHRGLAVDAYAKALFLSLNAYSPDSCQLLLQRLARYTRHDLTHPRSPSAQDYWLARALVFQRMGERDSCLHYLNKLVQPKGQSLSTINRGYYYLSQAYEEWGDKAAADACRKHQMDLAIKSQKNKVEEGSRMLIRIYQSLRTQLQQEQTNRRITWSIALGILVTLAFALSLLYRQRRMKRQHHRLLQQNAEYATLLASLHTQDILLESPIIKRFHELSSQDAHPSDAEWQQLYTLIEEQHPRLFGIPC